MNYLTVTGVGIHLGMNDILQANMYTKAHLQSSTFSHLKLALPRIPKGELAAAAPP